MKIGDDVLVIATREAGTVHRVDRLGTTTHYWLRMAALAGSRTPIDLGGPFAGEELGTCRPRR
ncbi:MAG: hypothetical protein M3O34_19380 [Chloroflexota bacterium]|nr:hypothetical protein [Chloroflexota bacterium]